MDVNTFDQTTPCGNCPFRSDAKRIDLNPGRYTEILESLLRGETPSFKCHKYLTEMGNSRVCAGAAAVTESLGRDMPLVQIAKRLGVIEETHYRQARSHIRDPRSFKIDQRRCHLQG